MSEYLHKQEDKKIAESLGWKHLRFSNGSENEHRGWVGLPPDCSYYALVPQYHGEARHSADMNGIAKLMEWLKSDLVRWLKFIEILEMITAIEFVDNPTIDQVRKRVTRTRIAQATLKMI